jgi:purine-cytosine permease-like protein
MGYMIATLANQPNFAPSMKYFASFTLFGVGALMMIVLLVNQWAVQDGNLYIAINGAQNLLSRIPRWRRQYTVVGLGLLAAGLTFILPNLTKTFNIVTGIGAVTVPVASTIMAMDVFVLPRLLGLRRPLHRVATWRELAFANWPGIVGLLAGTAVGAFTVGLVPGTSGFGKTYIGFPALQAWGTGAAVYLILVWVVTRVAPQARTRELLGYSSVEEPAVDEPAVSTGG